jgi:hypothetical protein
VSSENFTKIRVAVWPVERAQTHKNTQKKILFFGGSKIFIGKVKLKISLRSLRSSIIIQQKKLFDLTTRAYNVVSSHTNQSLKGIDFYKF